MKFESQNGWKCIGNIEHGTYLSAFRLRVRSQRKSKVWTKLPESGGPQVPQPLPLRGPCPVAYFVGEGAQPSEGWGGEGSLISNSAQGEGWREGGVMRTGESSSSYCHHANLHVL